MKNLFLTIMLLATSIIGISAQTTKTETFNDKSDLYIGYQYANSDVDRLRAINSTSAAQTFLSSGGRSHGFNVGLTYYGNSKRNFGAIVETSTTFGDRNVVNALTGVQLKKRAGTFQPFARGLVGFGGSINSNKDTASDRRFGLAYGGGIGFDVKASDKVSFRLASVDLIRTYNFDNKRNEDSVRFGVGLIF